MKGIKGFSLVELVVVIGIIGALLAVSAPSFMEWTQNARSKEAANLVLMAMRQAKGQAINLNQRVKVDFNLETSEVTMNIVGEAVFLTTKIPAGIGIKGGTNCTTTTGNVPFTFNPMGSSSSGFVCIFDGPTKKYKIGVGSSNTGRIRVEKF